MAIKVSIALKLIALAVVLTVVPTSAISYLGVQQMTELGDYALDSTKDLGDTATNDSVSALEALGQDMIQQKAEDVAKQLEIYIKDHPSMNVTQLQQDPEFSEMAVQPVGETGYTAITDVDSLVCRFHSSPAIVNLKLETLSGTLPGFWVIMSKSEGGVPSAGYYDWKDPDGTIRPKYMHIAIVNATTADSVTFSVAATTYIDEFSSPIKETAGNIANATAQTHDHINERTTQLFHNLIIIIFVLVLVVVICAVAFTRTITNPVSKLKEMTNDINKGDLDVKVRIDSSDEIGELATSFDAMRLSLKRSYETLEQKVKDRTKELDAAKNYAENIVRNMADTLIVVDAKGKIEKVNQATLDMLGHKGEKDLIGKDIEAVTDITFKELKKLDQVKDMEVYYRTKRGTRIPMSFSGSVMRTKKGKVQGIVCVAKDFTERQRLMEERQMAKEAAESSTRAKSEFLANMSHEIRTPMNGVLGMINLTLDTELTNEQREYLKLAETSALSLLSIINDILDISRIEARKLKLEEVDFDVKSVIEELVSLLGVEASKKKLELSYQMEKDMRSTFRGDPMRLQQVLLNLIKNAIKFTDKGQIRIGVSEVERTADEVKLHFKVEDTGRGIPRDKIPIIFELFTQVDGSETRKHEGTGLGLAICKNLVDIMGGKIWVESEVGKGSTFHFTTVFKISAKGPGDLPDRKAKKRKYQIPPGIRVLLAEDNYVNKRLCVRLLENQGVEVDAVENGLEVLKALETKDYHMILMDIQMPEMGGLEATKQIRKREEGTGKHTTIIALTAHAMYGDRERFLNAGMDDYLSKPLVPDHLMQKIWAYSSKGAEATKAQMSDAASADEQPEEVMFEPKDLLDRTDGDEELAKQLLNIFLKQTVEQLGEIEKAISIKDSKRIEFVAHSLKSSAANMSAMKVSAIARSFEMMGKSGDLSGANDLLVQLKESINKANELITSYLEGKDQDLGG